MGITTIPRLFEEKCLSASEIKGKTVGEVREAGKHYRHPDSALITYPKVTANPLGSLPEGCEMKIAVIGGGASGIASCYELSRLENSDRIHVTLYESDPEHFTAMSASPPSNQNIITFQQNAGRLFAARGSKNNHAVYEIGAMRFPETAGLTWHYVGAVYGDDKMVDAFPNPGKVPTEFVFGDRSDRYYNKGTGIWLDDDSPARHVRDVILEGIFGNNNSNPKNISYFPIDGKDPAKISAELKDPNTNDARLREIHEQWKLYATTYDELTLEAAVRRIIRGEVERLPEIDGLTKVEDKLNYYNELFGCFGFGTGGYKPIYNISLIEMMRLLLWDYSDDYSLPRGVYENFQFISDLLDKATTGENSLKVDVKKARVCDVCHSGCNGKALVFSYGIDQNGNELNEPPNMQEFDYVILAVTPKQMSSMICRAGYNNAARKVRFGDCGRQYPEDILARPPLVLSKNFDARNSQISTAINQVHMVSSSKTFVTIKLKDFEKYSPDFMGEGPIKSVISDCGLGSSYTVPCPHLSDRNAQVESDDEKFVSLLLSYTWEEDTKRMQNLFYEYPLNKNGDSDKNKKMIEAAINRTLRDIKDPDPKDGSYKPWWFGQLLSKSKLTDPLSHDWTTDYTAGAFKLDTTGCYYNSSLCFRYHTHVIDESLKNRFFIAGCSYTHLGGWLEGAFMSAVNAVAGLVVAANDGKIDVLTEEAKKVIVSLDSVITASC